MDGNAQLNYPEFRKIVELDLFGDATPDEEEILERNIEEWRLELVDSLRDLDKQFTSRRAAMLAAGTTEAKTEYATWKSKAAGRKLAIVNRIQDVNMIIKDRKLDLKDAVQNVPTPKKAAGSSANRGQMAAMILAANITAGARNPVRRTLRQIQSLCEGLAEQERNDSHSTQKENRPL